MADSDLRVPHINENISTDNGRSNDNWHRFFDQVATGINSTKTIIDALEASAADYQGNTAGLLALTPETVWTSVGYTALTDGSSIAVDMSMGFNFSVSIAGNRTLANPSNAKPGQSGCFKVTASSANRTIDLGTQYLFTTDLSFPVTITSGNTAYIFYFVDTATRILITAVLNNPT